MITSHFHIATLVLLASTEVIVSASVAQADVGVGARPVKRAEVIFDGTRNMLDEKVDVLEGAAFQFVAADQVEDRERSRWKRHGRDDGRSGRCGGKYGTADIVTKKKYRDFRLHVEFLVVKKGGNSGVYLQNRYEIQILDGDKSKHGMGAVINQTPAPYHAYKGIGKWNSYDINFRAARFKNGRRSQKAMVSMYFNGIKVHTNQLINQVVGGKNSGIDGGNNRGKGITDRPGGIKLQCEGHQVLYRNIWIKELDLDKADTDFKK